MPHLELQNLNKRYTKVVVPVKHLNLKVNQGEFLTLLGPSGCGKSTTLRLIAGLEPPTAGQIWLAGRDVTHLRAGDRNIAMVFQSYALYPHMNVAQNITSGLRLRRVNPAEIDRRMREVCRVLDLEDLVDRKPAQLSGGQRQRVAVARALVRRPDVFLLDEPLSNLDALLRERVRAELKTLFASQEAPVVYVTHDQTEAMTLSTQVAVLNQGELQQLDPPTRLYTHPANQFVASFVGSPQMNLLKLPCSDQYAALGGFKIPLPEGVPRSPEILLGIRPEHIQPVMPETRDQSNNSSTLTGQVYLVENLGMQNLLSLNVSQNDQPPISLRVLIPADQPWQADPFTFALPPSQIHWFNPQTGVRLGQ